MHRLIIYGIAAAVGVWLILIVAGRFVQPVPIPDLSHIPEEAREVKMLDPLPSRGGIAYERDHLAKALHLDELPQRCIVHLQDRRNRGVFVQAGREMAPRHSRLWVIDPHWDEPYELGVTGRTLPPVLKGHAWAHDGTHLNAAVQRICEQLGP